MKGSRRHLWIACAVLASAGAGSLPGQSGPGPTFSSHGFTSYQAGPIPEDLVIVDLNGDSILDLAVGNSNAGAPGPATETMSVYLGLGDGVLAPHVEYGAGDRPEGIAAGSFDAGGTIDLATADFEGNTVSVFLGKGDGTFPPRSIIAVPGGPRFVVAADFTKDSNLDLVTANHAGDSVSLLKGAGNGTFTVFGTTSVGNDPEVVAAGHLNADTDLDVATCNNLDDNVTVLHGDGAGNFAFSTSIATGDNPRFVKIVDLNGDGLGDILTANHTSGTVTIHRNNSPAAYTLQTTLSITGMSGPVYLNLGDLDDDGIPDLVTTYAMSDRLGIFPGSGGFVFGAGETIPTGDNPLGVAIADLDDSGHLDLVVTNALDDNVYVYLSSTGLGSIPVDNTDPAPATSKTGTWSVSSSPNPFGVNSLFAKSSAGTVFTWNANLPAAGTYAVYAWWTNASSRNTAAPYKVTHSSGSTTVNVNQKVNGGQWNLLGTFDFGTTGKVEVSANNSAVSTCADAVCFLPTSQPNQPPLAQIDSITPNPAASGEPVAFSGSGSDPDGSVAAYQWSSSLNGVIGNQASFSTSSLSSGVHTISFRVQDNDGLWSAEDTDTLTVGDGGTTLIMDNGDPGTSFTGSWLLSGAPNPFGANSLYAKNGPTYTYTFTIPTPGAYEVSAWWTQLNSRPSSAPYAITHSGGTTTVNVDQRVNGGQWNLLGTFTFGASAVVKITAVGSASTNADAIKLESSSNTPPVAEILSISPSPADLGEQVDFSGQGTDTDGTITGHEWRSSIDGVLSTLASFSTTALSAGTHTISYRVKDDQDVWSPDDTSSLVVEGTGTTLIMDNGAPGTSFTGTWTVSGAPNPFGTNSLYAKNGPTYTYTFNLSSPGTYLVRAWWTQLSSRPSAAPYEITHSGGTTTVNVDQRVNGGQWNDLGTFDFGTSAVVKITAVGTASTNADAISLVGDAGGPPPDVIIDNGTAGTSFTGAWLVSGGPNPFGTNSLYAKNGPTYTYTASVSGSYRVHAWWTQWPSRSTSVPIDIQHSDGTTTVNVDQQANGGQWNLLGTFTFLGQGIVTIRALGDGVMTTSADAIRFEPVP